MRDRLREKESDCAKEQDKRHKGLTHRVWGGENELGERHQRHTRRQRERETAERERERERERDAHHIPDCTQTHR